MDRTRPVNGAVACRVVWGLALALSFAPSLRADDNKRVRYQPPDLKALEDAFVKLADDVRPSVVAIRTYTVYDSHVSDSGTITAPLNQGSGFILDTNGSIATNHHLIAGADLVTVTLSTGQRYDAEVRQIDRRSDLAVVHVDADRLTPIRRGDAGGVKVGQWAFACGNPFGLANHDGRASMTFGLINALGREITDRLDADQRLYYYGNLIETTAAINPGSSGGPLFNIGGEVIGVVTAIETASGVSEGTGFAIPINDSTWRILTTLASGEPVRYGFIGVNIGDVPQPRSRVVAHTLAHRGAMITAIRPADGPAGKAGLLANDVVTQVDGTLVEDSDHLVRLIQYSPVDSEVEITYMRKGVKRKTTVKLADRDELLGVRRGE